MEYNAVARPATYADNEKLHALLTNMRHHDPIALIETGTHRPFWVIAKHADVIQIERQNELFINAPRAVLASIEMEKAAESRGALIRTLINMDEPDHRVFRDMTKDWFMPTNLKSVEPRVTALAKQVVDRMLELGEEFDFVKDVAVWYPLRVIMMILGVPEKDEALMLKLTQELFGADDPDMQRKSTSDQERMARGRQIEAGELMYASANRDEEVFDAPFEFRADRRPNKHVAFGHGAHHCLGNLLATMEMRALYREIFSRVKSIDLVGEPKWVQSTFVSGLKTLPVRVRAN